MKVADFINSCEGVFKIALYENDTPICYTRSDWEGVTPYMSVKIDHIKIRDDPSGSMVQVDIHLALKGE